MYLDRVSRIRNSSALPIARSDCLSGDMRERIHIDNIAGHLVIIYTDGDRPAPLPARECIRADVVDCSFHGDNEVVVDVLQHILRVQFVQIHQFSDTRKNIRCTDPLAVNHQILFGVSIVICHQKLHDRSSSSFLYSYHSFRNRYDFYAVCRINTCGCSRKSFTSISYLVYVTGNGKKSYLFYFPVRT